MKNGSPPGAGELRLVLGYALMRNQNKEDAVDVAQEAWLRFFNEEAEVTFFKAYMWKVVQNVSSEIKRKRKMVQTSQSRAAAGNDPQSENPTPVEQALSSEQVSRLLAVVAELSQTDRDVLQLRFFDGLANDETAQRLGISPSAATNRKNRALDRIREKLVGDID